MTDEPTKTYAEAEAKFSGILNTFTLARSISPTYEKEGEHHAHILKKASMYVKAGLIPPQHDITAGDTGLSDLLSRHAEDASYWLKPGLHGLQLDLWVYSELFGVVCPGNGGNLTFGRSLADPVLSMLPYILPHTALDEVKRAWKDSHEDGHMQYMKLFASRWDDGDEA